MGRACVGNCVEGGEELPTKEGGWGKWLLDRRLSTYVRGMPNTNHFVYVFIGSYFCFTLFYFILLAKIICTIQPSNLFSFSKIYVVNLHGFPGCASVID